MATDKQRALDALAALGQPRPPAPDADAEPGERILADVDALLVLIDHHANKLALALRPPNPAYAPAVPVIAELTQHVTKLVYAAHLLHDDVHGATLTRLVRRHVDQVIDALRDLAQSFITDDGENYLVKVGTLHDLIETARGPSGIPKDNQTAAYLSWKSVRESLDDSLREVAEILQDTPDVDDGWDEIDITHTTSLDELELSRANKVHQILRITTLLHKRILLDILSYPTPVPLSAFDALVRLSDELLTASDDLVAAIYSPQDPDQVREETLRLIGVVTRIHTQLTVFLPAVDQLTQQLLAISLKDAPTSKKRADKKWFDTCVDQIVRLCSKLTEE